MKGRARRSALFSMLLMMPFAAWGASCTASGTALAFGTYTGTQLAVSATITTSCPSGASYQVGLNAGTDTVTVTGTGSKVTTVYGLLPASQSPTPGTYKDTITIYIYSSLGTFTGTIKVTSTVSAYCELSATALSFGTYSGAVLKVDSALIATCTNTTPYNVGLIQGTASGATVTTRKMTGPSSSLLNYTLFSNSGLTTNWGNTVGTSTLAGTGNGSAQTLTVYGEIPAAQYVRPGSYSDTITATITY
jgi:spore coat protein U-like protein